MAAVARRVIVWGTGNVGRAALRAVLADPGLALAGVVVSQAEKVYAKAREIVTQLDAGTYSGPKSVTV